MAHRFAPYNGKKYQPTEELRRQVLTMTGFGIRQDEIAISLQIDKKTLHKYYRRELDTGMIQANVRVAKALYQNAVEHMNVAAQIWWTKTRMGWKEASDLNITGGTTSDIRLHLIAAQLVSQQLGALQRAPQTIQHSEPPLANLLDAPTPTE